MTEDSHKIVIEGCTYEVSPAGTDRYAVADEFGTPMGYFEIRGKFVVPDEYGTGTHSVRDVGKLFREHLEGRPKTRKLCRQVCQVVSFDAVTEDDLPKIDRYRKWLKTQPGLKAAFFVRDPESGKGRSVRVWSTKERMATFAALTAPEGAAEPASSGTEVTPLIEDM
ncbi:MAG: hypothetical protein IPM79_39220 [Polyangiaceae bacterium]|nr:hypothetical protein [Polyangiaceae bacterium]MBK8943474.1 hypothetical protein [Polyangiaceae bacterium]